MDLTVSRGEVFGLIGESGYGKSATLLSIMRLIGAADKVLKGEIIFEERNLSEYSEAKMVHALRADVSDFPITAIQPKHCKRDW